MRDLDLQNQSSFSFCSVCLVFQEVMVSILESVIMFPEVMVKSLKVFALNDESLSLIKVCKELLGKLKAENINHHLSLKLVL